MRVIATVVPLAGHVGSTFDEDDIGATFPLVSRPGPLKVIALVRAAFIGTAPGQVQDPRRQREREPTNFLSPIR